ncbi:MAG: hypothetical protein L3J53_09095 [Proteobacteria bacterium]|nr:hypothetical protein [Pseudomonadota bacterium]
MNRNATSFTGSERLYPANRQHAIRFYYDYVNRQATMDNSLEYSGFFSFLKYPTQDFFARAFYKVGDTQNSWSIRPVITPAQAPANDLSGLWWAGSDDAGWGISLSFVQRQNSQEVVAIVYLYDENGEPRWLLGQQDNFELGKNVTIAMQQINGYGREQNYVELTELDAGSITINLTQASQDFSQAGTLSMDIQYPTDTLNDNWVREDIPLALFSKPKN